MSESRLRFMRIVFACIVPVLVFMGSYAGLERTTFLSDQLDQTLQFHDLMAGDLRALYGPFMSGTDPAAYNFGPLGAFYFGTLDYFLALSPEQNHLLQLVLLSVAWAGFVLVVPVRSLALFIAVFTLLLSEKTFWFLNSAYWINSLLLPGAGALFALWLRLRESGDWSDLVWIAVVCSLGMQVHATALPAWSLVGCGLMLLYWRGVKLSLHSLRLPLFCLALCWIPYMIAELRFGGANTMSLIANMGKSTSWTTGLSSVVAMKTTIQAGLQQIAPWLGVLFVPVYMGFMGGLVWAAWRRLNKDRRIGLTEFEHVGLGAVVFVSVTVAFFLVTKRPFQSGHYLSLVSPWLFLPFAYCIVWVVRRGFADEAKRLIVLGCILVGLYWQLSELRSGAISKDRWTYSAISSAVDQACERAGSMGQVLGPEFHSYRNGHPSVLQFVAGRRAVECRVGDSSDYLIRAERRASLRAQVELDGLTYEKVASYKPNIALYRLEDTSRR